MRSSFSACGGAVRLSRFAGIIGPCVQFAFISRRTRRIDFLEKLGGADMTDTIDERTRELGPYVLETGATVRAAAERFGVSKSTVHKDLTERLERVDRLLWLRVRVVLDRNKAERHLRGGEATRRRYERIRD